MAYCSGVAVCFGTLRWFVGTGLSTCILWLRGIEAKGKTCGRRLSRNGRRWLGRVGCHGADGAPCSQRKLLDRKPRRHGFFGVGLVAPHSFGRGKQIGWCGRVCSAGAKWRGKSDMTARLKCFVVGRQILGGDVGRIDRGTPARAAVKRGGVAGAWRQAGPGKAYKSAASFGVVLWGLARQRLRLLRDHQKPSLSDQPRQKALFHRRTHMHT